MDPINYVFYGAPNPHWYFHRQLGALFGGHMPAHCKVYHPCGAVLECTFLGVGVAQLVNAVHLLPKGVAIWPVPKLVSTVLLYVLISILLPDC